MGKLHFTPLNYPPIFTVTSKVSNVTLNPAKCQIATQTFKLWQFDTFGLFIPKMPSSHLKKEIQKKKKKKPKYIYIYAGVSEPPHRWWLATPFGQGVVRLPLGRPSGGGRTTRWATRGGSTAPRPASLGVAEPPLGQTGWPATCYRLAGHTFGFFFFFFWIFFKKKM
jgi:hypothetical protein